MIIAQGAEAVLERQDNLIVKKRLKKAYRIAQLDDSLRKFRTKREIKILENASKAGLPVPSVLEKDTYEFAMQYLDGKKVRDVLDEKPKMAKEAGQLIAKMHDMDIIHGDLTTSNMIWFGNKVHLIDFGLSKISPKLEDKAVDVHLFKQALESKHHRVYDKALKLFLKGYKNSKQAPHVLKQLEQVEARGRYKQKA